MPSSRLPQPCDVYPVTMGSRLRQVDLHWIFGQLLKRVYPMLQSAFLVFLAGWMIRFLIDKPPTGQLGLPEVSDSMLENFQQSFDMLKAGHMDMAYVFIWDAHYLVLSLLGGILIGLLYGAISDHLGRRRLSRNFLPYAGKNKPDTGKSEATDLEAEKVDK